MKEDLQLERIELKEKFRSYTVPVGYYDIYSGRDTDRIIDKIKFGNNEEIFVVKAYYDKELGFQRLRSEDLKT